MKLNQEKWKIFCLPVRTLCVEGRQKMGLGEFFWRFSFRQDRRGWSLLKRMSLERPLGKADIEKAWFLEFEKSSTRNLRRVINSIRKINSYSLGDFVQESKMITPWIRAIRRAQNLAVNSHLFHYHMDVVCISHKKFMIFRYSQLLSYSNGFCIRI